MQFARSRFAVLALVALLVAAPAAVSPAAAADARLAVTDTTVSPATPTAGAPVTVSATVRLSAGSNTSLALDSVRLEHDDGNVLTADTEGNATDLGTLSPGETLTVPVTFRVDRPGVYDLELVAVGTDATGDTVRATRPLTVGVEAGAPQVELQTAALVAGAESPVQAVVSNPTNAPLRGIELEVTDPASGERLRRTVPTLAAGASATVNFSVRPPTTGNTTLAATTTFTDATGSRRTATVERSVSVSSRSVDVGVRAERATTDGGQQVPDGLAGALGGGGSALGGGSESDGESDDGGTATDRVDVTVTNFGNAPVENVVLRGETGDGALLPAVGRFSVADSLGPGESATVTVDLSRVGSVDGLRFVASYEGPAGSAESALRYDYSTARGNATVTGLDVTVAEDGSVAVDGNLANTGDGEVRSAVVSVQPGDAVRPSYPQRTYFVGTVAPSEFAPFELTAEADPANATGVTLRLAYATGDGRVTRTVTAPLPSADSADGAGLSTQPAGLFVLLAGGLAVGVGAVLLGRRARGR